ncbi:PilZ domain-containing protein [Azohydromonas caseinilytica]|uniref:PilZ domain-containing protein n=1 Tax=Azohydromonas caseinilytica TaxID=2728836 RepID=A0A848FAA3_9BURK|nr:PilZ domain-containing protein [Azohydromonas caseinilytica]NML15796.1 PilZ domain-containing protein [Azohydromonas caseinilytica]
MMESGDIATWVNLGLDRRQVDRKAFRSLGLLRLPSRQVLEVRTVDISVGGMGVVAPWNLQRDLCCDIRLRAPVMSAGMDFLVLRCRVAHSILSGKADGFMIGLEFLDPPAAVLDVVRQYVTE